MSAKLNSLNVHNFLIFQPILMALVSKVMVYRAFFSDKTYILLGLRSPFIIFLSPAELYYPSQRLLKCFALRHHDSGVVTSNTSQWHP